MYPLSDDWWFAGHNLNHTYRTNQSPAVPLLAQHVEDTRYVQRVSI